MPATAAAVQALWWAPTHWLGAPASTACLPTPASVEIHIRLTQRTHLVPTPSTTHWAPPPWLSSYMCPADPCIQHSRSGCGRQLAACCVRVCTAATAAGCELPVVWDSLVLAATSLQLQPDLCCVQRQRQTLHSTVCGRVVSKPCSARAQTPCRWGGGTADSSHPHTSAVHAEMALATNRLAKGSCGPPDDATILCSGLFLL
jgi:hypothetical protein